MGNEAALRSSMVGLAVVMLVIWLWTQSLKKTVVTYAVGISLIGGILLPDWDFFDRSFSRWGYPVTAEERAAALARKSHPSRFRVYPMRMVLYGTVYGYAVYRWWMFVSNY
ncbi:Microsomal signal peptidase 12kDa subunit [Arabidopsis suecica]|uniref:Microsomal signal peptidase 12kDa subunit n=1 Tax=Arabidopsis suecica TaxID=45249 RepID=A0A8T2CIB1_ARASU|nr:Microsomal signal peptidase 12kDa subunit [Arabidopsis suecica]